MAWSSVAIPAAELALFNADKVMIVGRNWNRNLDVANHVWSDVTTMATPSSSWVDESDANGKADYGGDDFIHLQTFPDSSLTAWWYAMDLGAEVEIDTVALIDPVFTVSPYTILVEVADNAAFSTNLTTIVNYSVTGNEGNRIGFVDLDHTATAPRRYTAQFIRVKFSAAAGNVPKVAEVVVGRRRQLKHYPDLPYDNANLSTAIGRYESRTGIGINFVSHKGRRLLDATITPHEDAYIDDVVTWFEDDTDFGTQPFLWWDEPLTSPHNCPFFLLDEPGLAIPFVGVFERQYTFVATEQGPKFVALG